MDKRKVLKKLLRTYKRLTIECRRLELLGINIKSLNDASDVIFDCIKVAVDMPETEILGEWVSDYWFDIVFSFVEGECDENYTINELINWNKADL